MPCCWEILTFFFNHLLVTSFLEKYLHWDKHCIMLKPHCSIFQALWNIALSFSNSDITPYLLQERHQASPKKGKKCRPILSDSCSSATKVISNASRSIHLISSTSPRVLNVIIVPPSTVPREPFPLHAQLWPSPGPSALPPPEHVTLSCPACLSPPTST